MSTDDDRPDRLTLSLRDESATAALGRAMARALGAGDVLFLSGPLGAGKSALARAIIRQKLGDEDIEVPSPSYTLVNVYDSCDTEIWHADLYRLSEAEELGELGLADAWGRALVLVEWPEKIGNDKALRRLEIELGPTVGGGRIAIVTAHGCWNAVMERIRGFA